MLDYLLSPDLPSQKEEWVEAQVDREYNDIERWVGQELPSWFSDYVDWSGVEEELQKQFDEQWEEAQAERQISELEDQS